MASPPIDPAFLRARELFENQPDEVLQAVLRPGPARGVRPRGRWSSARATQGDRLYIVKSGVLEILAAPADGAEPVPVAYLGRGRGAGRAGAAHRVAAHARPSARRSTPSCSPSRRRSSSTSWRPCPRFARNLCLVLAGGWRPPPSRCRARRPSSSRATCSFFDLATVIQTLIGSHQTGSLVVTQDGGKQQGRRDLLLQGQHRPAPGAAPDRRRRRLPALPVAAGGRVLLHRPDACRRRRCRPTSPCPPSPCSWSRCGCRTSCRCCRRACPTRSASSGRRRRSSQWEDAGDGRAGGRGLVAAQEGRVGRRPAARHPALLVRDLQDDGRP